MLNYTIIALATAPTKQAISIIRISGENTFKIVNNIFKSDILHSQKSKIFGKIINPITNEIIDEVVLICYRSPKSFTGEDVIEINCHGSMLIINKIIELLLTINKDSYVRLATKGEFTRRAYLNGKIDILQAQAVNDLINASNNTSLAIAMNSLNGNNSKSLSNLENDLLAIIANIEVNIDYPEYDGVTNLTKEIVLKQTIALYKRLLKITKQSKIAKIITDGIDTVIIGKPNVGKSTLLNALLNENRAIISPIAGTTRDVIIGNINIDNITLNLIDTAGIRNTDDIIEQLGIEKSKQYLKQAQLVLLLLDSSTSLDSNDKLLLDLTKDKTRIIVLNKTDLEKKIDLNTQSEEIVLISALNNDFKPLINKIKATFISEEITYQENLVLTNILHQTLLNKIIITIEESLIALENNIPLDLVVIHFKEAWDFLQEINGKIIKENILDEMFKRFCLGK